MIPLANQCAKEEVVFECAGATCVRSLLPAPPLVSPNSDLPIAGEFRCGKRGTYRLVKLLGRGGFGAVYTAENVHTGVVDALKLVEHGSRKQLKREWTKLRQLGGRTDSGIPRAYWFGRIDQHWCLLMQGLGMSLADKFAADKRQWSVATVARIAIQMLDVLEFVHAKHIVHLDIKPRNWLLDRHAGERLYLIDFGLSKYYANATTGEHIEQPEGECDATKEGMLVVGTASFCSVRAHEHVRLSRRDDIEEVAYNVAFWLRGRLPWYVSESVAQTERNKQIYAVKRATSARRLFRGQPTQFRQLLAHARQLAFDEKPNYALMRKRLGELLEEKNSNTALKQ